MRGKRKTIVALAALCIVAVAILAYLLVSPGEPSAPVLTVDIKPTDMVKGSADAPITIVEYASLSCPHCADFHVNVLPLIERDYISTGKVKLVFRDFPTNPPATMAHSFAHCMTGDSYFALIGQIFEHQANWLTDVNGDGQGTEHDIEEGLVAEGRLAGIPREEVIRCIHDQANLDLVIANFQEGQNRYNVQATPTFIVGGRLLLLGIDREGHFNAFKQILDPLLLDRTP
jgi:protein-disulfide isomerase